MTTSDEDDFIEVKEEVTFVITCYACRIRFKADSFDRAARVVDKHRRAVHDTGRGGK